MRGPPRVSQSDPDIRQWTGKNLLKVLYFAFGLIYLYAIAVLIGNSCRVISSVFKSLQTVKKYGKGIFFTNITDYAAHAVLCVSGASLKSIKHFSLIII